MSMMKVKSGSGDLHHPNACDPNTHTAPAMQISVVSEQAGSLAT